MRLARWVDNRARAARSKEAALSLLRAQPGGPLVAFPYRFVDRKAYEDVFSTSQINAAIDAAPVTDVPLSSIVGIQHTVSKERVAQYIENPKLRRRGVKDPRHGGVVDLPIVVRWKGQNYLHDGHHRATATAFLGGRLLECRFADLDAASATG